MSALAIARIRRLASGRGLDRLRHRIRWRLHRLRSVRDLALAANRERLRLAATGSSRSARSGARPARPPRHRHQRDHARAVDIQLLDAA